KTEMDATAIEVYEKFKTHAPSMRSVPNTPLGKDEYENVRAWLNICDLIAVGVRKGAFSESVSYAYWGEEIPTSYQTPKELIIFLHPYARVRVRAREGLLNRDGGRPYNFPATCSCRVR